MNKFNQQKWEKIKIIAARLQAIKSLLEIFNRQIEEQPLTMKSSLIREQLEADFEQTLDELLIIIDEDDE